MDSRAHTASSLRIGAFLALTLGGVPVASAQDGAARLIEAEAAYERLEVDVALELADRAERSGGLTEGEVRRVYRLAGLAHAVLGHYEDARTAYLRLLAVDPAATTGADIAPRLREPFFAARAYWAQRAPFGIEASVGEHGLLLELEDPLQLAQRIELAIRSTTGDSFDVISLSAAPRNEHTLPRLRTGASISYFVTVFDAYGNRLASLGSRVTPRIALMERAARPALTTAEYDGSEAADASSDGIFESPWFWLAGGLAAAALAGVIAAVLLLGPREGRFAVVTD